MEELKAFLENWKKEVKNYYIGLARKYICQEIGIVELKENLSDKDFKVVHNLIYTFRVEDGKNEEKILRFIDKEAEKKEIEFKNKVKKYVGEIISCENLRTSVSYGIDGVIEGTSGKVKVETVMAGGYNIQRLHFRILVKKMK